MEKTKDVSEQQCSTPTRHQAMIQQWCKHIEPLQSEREKSTHHRHALAHMAETFPELQQVQEKRQAWAKWLETKAKEQLGHSGGIVSQHVTKMSPRLKAKVHEMRQKIQKKNNAAAGNAESSGRDGDGEEIVMIQENESSSGEDDFAMVATKTAHLGLDDQPEEQEVVEVQEAEVMQEKKDKEHKTDTAEDKQRSSSSMDAMMKSHMKQWRQHMRRLLRHQQKHKSRDQRDHTLPGSVPPHINRAYELHRSWRAWVRSQPSDEPEPFHGKAPLFLVPPCLRKKVDALRKQKKGTELGLSDGAKNSSGDEDMELGNDNCNDGAKETDSDQEVMEETVSTKQATKQGQSTDEKCEEKKQEPASKTHAKEIYRKNMQEFRSAMRNLRNMHHHMASHRHHPCDHPRKNFKGQAAATWFQKDASPANSRAMSVRMMYPRDHRQTRKRCAQHHGHGPLHKLLKKLKIGDENTVKHPESKPNRCSRDRFPGHAHKWRQPLKEAGVTTSPQEIRSQWLAWLRSPGKEPMPCPPELAPPRIRRAFVHSSAAPGGKDPRQCYHRRHKMHIVLRPRSPKSDSKENAVNN